MSNLKMQSKKLDLSRTKGAVDSSMLNKTHVVCVGVGGANQLVENLVRTGVGRVSIIDFDTVDSPNLSVQGWYQSDLGKLKVEALKSRCLDINPQVKINAVAEDFMEMNSTERECLIATADIVLMMTDNFYVQAVGNLLVLKHKKPAVFANIYQYARAGEITFSIPGVTPACHRCCVSPRYDAYLKEGFVNNVSSTGSTMFPTQYTNSALGLIILSILHANCDSEDIEFSGIFDHNWEFNLLQFRMSPKFNLNFDENNKESYFLDSCWQQIEPEIPPKYAACPDCGGQGDLLNIDGINFDCQIATLSKLYSKNN